VPKIAGGGSGGALLCVGAAVAVATTVPRLPLFNCLQSPHSSSSFHFFPFVVVHFFLSFFTYFFFLQPFNNKSNLVVVVERK
jgi:hypothetical protein